MTSKHSSFNKKFFKETFKQYYYALTVCIFAFGFYFLFNTVACVDNYTKGGGSQYIITSLSYFLTSRNMGYPIIFFGLGIPAIMFKYLHSKKQIDLFHSIPVSRTTLFFNNYITGLLLVLPAYIISLAISYLYAKASIPEFYLSPESVIIGACVKLILFMLVYNISVIANILAGNTFIGIALSVMLIACFDLIKSTIRILIGTYFSNIHFSSYSDTNLFKNSFINNLMSFNIENFYASNLNDGSMLKIINNSSSFDYRGYTSLKQLAFLLISYVVLAIILIFIAHFLYKKRGSESASNCLSFELSKPIFKYLGVVIFSIIGAIFVNMTFYSNYILYVALVVLCILLHCLIEAIYNFDFKALFKNKHHIFPCIVISICILLLFKFDIFGLDNKVPVVSKIESAEILDIYSSSESINNLPILNLSINGSILLESEEALTALTNFHKTAVGSNPEVSTNTNMYNATNGNAFFNGLKIKYNMENGSSMIRYISPNMESIPYLEDLINSEDYLNTAIIFNDEYVGSYTVDQASISNNQNYYSNFNNLDKDLLNEFMQVLQSDIKKYGLIPSNNVSYLVSDLYMSILSTSDNYLDLFEIYNYNDSYNPYVYDYYFVSTKKGESLDIAGGILPTTSLQMADVYIYDEYESTIDFINKNLSFSSNKFDLTKENVGFVRITSQDGDSRNTIHYEEQIDDKFLANLQFVLDNSDSHFYNFSSYQSFLDDISNEHYAILYIESNFYYNYYYNYTALRFIIKDPDILEFALNNF